MAAAAKALDAAGRDKRANLRDLLAAVEERAAIAFRSIETLRPPEPLVVNDTSRSFDPRAAGAVLERLAIALDEYDLSSANGALADLSASGLPAWAADDLGRLRHCVDGYEYSEARGIASRLLARVHAGEA